MTVQEAIDYTDTLKPNPYPDSIKRDWLSRLDGKIYEELLCTHEDPPASFQPYADSTADLLVPEPWCGDVYNYYLQSMIDRETGEIAKYNQSAGLYNQAYLEYGAAYNRTHAPRPAETRFRF